jgi:hypothetical protein
MIRFYFLVPVRLLPFTKVIPEILASSLSENTTKLLFCKNIDLYQHD